MKVWNTFGVVLTSHVFFIDDGHLSKLAVGRVLSHSSFILMASFSLWPSVCDGRLYRVYVQWLILVWLVCHLGECTVLYLDLVNWLHVSEIFWDCFATVALVTLQSILLSPISMLLKQASLTQHWWHSQCTRSSVIHVMQVRSLIKETVVKGSYSI